MLHLLSASIFLLSLGGCQHSCRHELTFQLPKSTLSTSLSLLSHVREINKDHTSPTTLWALSKALVLPVVQFLSLQCPALLLLFLHLFHFFTFSCFTQIYRAGTAVARLAGSRFDPLAFIIWHVHDCLGERQQHLALDRPMLGPSTTCPAAGLPGTGDKAGEESKQQMTQVEKYENFDKDCFQTKPGLFDSKSQSIFFLFCFVFAVFFSFLCKHIVFISGWVLKLIKHLWNTVSAAWLIAQLWNITISYSWINSFHVHPSSS